MTRRGIAPSGFTAGGLLLIGLLASPGQTSGQDVGQADDRAAELTDRFADRVAEALHLDDDRAARLRRALQESRVMRGQLANRRRSLFRELAGLVRQDQVDQERVSELLDEVLRLQLREAEINLDEQRRLSEFMAPLERARVLWIRQRMLQQARQRGQDFRQNDQIPRNRRPPPAAEQRNVPRQPQSRGPAAEGPR